MILLGDIQNEVFDYEYIEKYQHYPKMAIAHRISSLGLESTAESVLGATATSPTFFITSLVQVIKSKN